MNDNISLLFFFCLLFSIPRSQENLKTKVKGTCMCYSSRDQSSSIETKVCFYTRFNNILCTGRVTGPLRAKLILRSTYHFYLQLDCSYFSNFFFLNVANAYKEKKWSYNFLTCTFSTTAHSCCRVMTPHSTWCPDMCLEKKWNQKKNSLVSTLLGGSDSEMIQ